MYPARYNSIALEVPIEELLMRAQLLPHAALAPLVLAFLPPVHSASCINTADAMVAVRLVVIRM